MQIEQEWQKGPWEAEMEREWIFELNGVNVGSLLQMQKEEVKKETLCIKQRHLFILYRPAAGLPSLAGFWLNQSTHSTTARAPSAITLRDHHPKLLTFRIFYLWLRDCENNHLATCPAVWCSSAVFQQVPSATTKDEHPEGARQATPFVSTNQQECNMKWLTDRNIQTTVTFFF